MFWLLLTDALHLPPAPPSLPPPPAGMGLGGTLVPWFIGRRYSFTEFGGPETERSEQRRILSSPTRLACPPPSNLGRYREERQPAQSPPSPQATAGNSSRAPSRAAAGAPAHGHLTAAGYIGHQAAGAPLALALNSPLGGPPGTCWNVPPPSQERGPSSSPVAPTEAPAQAQAGDDKAQPKSRGCYRSLGQKSRVQQPHACSGADGTQGAAPTGEAGQLWSPEALGAKPACQVHACCCYCCGPSPPRGAGSSGLGGRLTLKGAEASDQQTPPFPTWVTLLPTPLRPASMPHPRSPPGALGVGAQ